MSFLRAARAALVGQSAFRRMLAAAPLVFVLVLGELSLSCGNNGSPGLSSAPNHIAYVTLPASGSVLLLQVNGQTGGISSGGQTPPVQGNSPTGLALTPSKRFLYAINSRANTISIFNVANNGILTLSGTPVQAGNGPNAAIVDPTGQYLLVTNNFSNNISVYSIDSGSGALSELTGSGSPFFANQNPTEILFSHSGQFVYVTNPSIGMVTGFAFANGVLTQLPSSPVLSGAGAAALAVDASDQFLYVVNPSASNPPPYTATLGNISAFNIDSTTGALTPILGSPFTSTAGTGPTAIVVDPTGRFVYAASPGSSDAIWCFAITPTNGELVAAAHSPFSSPGGGLFALFDPSGKYFYIGSATGKGLVGYTYNPSTGALVNITGSPFSTGTSPGKMVFSN
jgi:6-phosphogluconolactonase